jgi:hypothetical protein
MESFDRYLPRLLDPDLRLLAAAGGGPAMAPERLMRDPGAMDAILRSDRLFDVLFRNPERDPLLVASPFLVFWVLVHRVARDLEGSPFVEERIGPRRSVPVFDTASLQDFLAEGGRRAFLAELLASYIRVSSGSIWERTARGWHRRRFSDLDPLRLAQLVEAVPDYQRPQVYRRLGDLALFLSGVFPEHVAAHPLQPRHVERLRRVLNADGPEEVIRAVSPEKGLWLLEWLGRAAYRLAQSEELAGVAEAFSRGRRVLNLLTSRYLYPTRERWFPGTGG